MKQIEEAQMGNRLWGDKNGGGGAAWEAEDDSYLGRRMLAVEMEGLTVSTEEKDLIKVPDGVRTQDVTAVATPEVS